MKTKKNYILAFSVFGLILLFLFSGYIIGYHNFPPSQLLRKVEIKLMGHYLDRIQNPTSKPEYYESIFLRLDSREASLREHLTRNGRGGGLTSFGDAVLLLTYDGQIFAARSADNIQKTGISVPDNGFLAYKQAAESDQFSHLNHNFGLYRYNDILFYEAPGNRGLAISYTEFDSTENCYRNTVATLPVEPGTQSVEQLSARPGDWDIIYRAQPCLPFKNINNALEGGLAGGRIAFRAPSTLYLGNGDYHWDGMYAPKAIAQDPGVDYGKIMSIDLQSRESRIIASGIRNPQGLALDNEGTLWEVEHGLRGGDELNRIEEGNNYGWPVETLGTQYSKLPIPGEQSPGRHSRFVKPIFSWIPSVAISNLTLTEGFHESWDGDLLMASLKSMSLFRIRIEENRVMFTERIEIDERIRYVHQHTDGRLVLWTDSSKLIFLTPHPYRDHFVTDFLDSKKYEPGLKKRLKITIDGCRQCHSIDPDNHEHAPSLAMLFDAEIGSASYSDYSSALEAKKGTWNRTTLKAFLSDPETFAPGTTMPRPGINDDTVMEGVIDFLEAASTNGTGL
ncbi:PQQ-dependent sugar dehydrogenase [Halalkalibaculum sp. DA3122]|uniref:PQQ-dependent sugar dehydrogenase n=1 Tax=Halalkalibaculum sp. DA3122 TaxID=3373607 RepID=UPI003755193C